MLSLTSSMRGTSRERGRVFRTAALLIAALSVAACAGRPAQAPIAVLDASPTEQSALRNILLAKKSGSESGASSRTNQVLAFYQSRNFAPAWVADAQEDMAVEVRAVLARAHEQGLSDDDYKLSRKDSASAAALDSTEAAQYDIALTDAVLRYAHDLRTGRIEPNAIYEDVELPFTRSDNVADLSKALANHGIAKFLADLSPPHPEYRRLAEALARYRGIADAGGWPSLPGQNEIKLDGKDSRLGLLIKRLSFEDPTLAAIGKPSMTELRDAVKRFQLRNGLVENGRAAGETLAALNVPAAVRVAQIAANMERWRWMPRQFERRYVAVNVPDQSLVFVRDATVALSSRVIVGRKTSPTPITRSSVIAVVANPPWNIPGDIAARDLLPQLQRNPNYLALHNMVVTDAPADDPHGRKIDWRKIIPAEFPYAIRQLPGPTTALGALMLDSPNDFDVYLHDTPNKKFFESEQREISNGCVRVQQIFPLASLALTGDAAEGMQRLTKVTKSHETQRLVLDSPLPVYFLYWTALAGSDGQIGFRPDIYGRDATLIAALTKGHSGGPMSDGQLSAKPVQASPSETDEPSP
jgi:murein L,D-transpeptidase YcbB/YkuD